MPGKKVRFFRKLVTVLFITLVVLIILEVAFIVLNRFAVCSIFYDKRYMTYWSKPGSFDYDFKINSQGFKDQEFTREKKEGIYRITAVGDSFAFGTVPYRYNYLTFLEEYLNKNRGKFEVYNFGEPSIGPHDYVSILVHECLQYDPDMMLVCVTLVDDLGRRKRHTYLYITSLVKYLVDSMKSHEGIVVHGRGVYRDNTVSMPKKMYMDYVIKKSDIYLKSNKKQLKKKYRNTVYYLGEIQDICRKKDIVLVVALMNSEMQVDDELQEKLADAMGVCLGDLDFSMPNRFLRRELGDMGITVVDLLDEFLSVSERAGKRYYIPRNFHYNIAGNKLAARILEKHLSEIIKNDR